MYVQVDVLVLLYPQCVLVCMYSVRVYVGVYLTFLFAYKSPKNITCTCTFCYIKKYMYM